MRRGLATLATIVTVTLWVSVAWAISVDNVIQMHKSGLPPAVIVQTITVSMNGRSRAVGNL